MSLNSLKRKRPVTYRYSEAFKLHVIKEIESGRLSMSSAQRKYDISGGATIPGWLKRYGKNHLLAKVVRVERAEERNRIKRLEEEKRELEQALAQSHIKQLALESLVEVAEEYYNADFKKNFGHMQSKEHSRKKKRDIV
ncbi:transposase [Pseudoalteromonas sp.]|uniref:transposase n=1 Tax=Pseudoalteromonas sp. TaxID=53249 RepID=UPI00263A0778|nr:transposase [Pseudoalteromonas sp.]MCP4584375.1 transposase [Pseudoalteromonas sp.]